MAQQTIVSGSSSVVPPTATYSMASLYVGDLHQDVNESMLFEKFSMIGPVLSIRVCRDNSSRQSLGYAYVNFQKSGDAERALDLINFDIMHGKPMRIMWSQRDPATRRSGNGNIFIKNLDKSIDNKAIYDTFSLFGGILSCKVATDEQGNSKGYGFVHFENEVSALTAIEKVNGMLLGEKKVYVGKFKPRAERMKELGQMEHVFTNVFVKNFGDKLNKEQLESLFKKFGSITSAVVMCDNEGASKGFGFVAYSKPEEAQKAVETMNGYEVDGPQTKLVVCRAQKKSERMAELKQKHQAFIQERIQRYQGVNLYVKNLDEDMDDEELYKHFKSFGNITSAKVMRDENGRSRGFGFVCFEKPSEATAAVTDMNTKIVSKKPLYVALAQRKEDRRAQLASKYMKRLANMRMHNQIPGAVTNIFTPSQGAYFVANPLQAPNRFIQQDTIRNGRVFPANQFSMQYQQPFNNGRGLILPNSNRINQNSSHYVSVLNQRSNSKPNRFTNTNQTVKDDSRNVPFNNKYGNYQQRSNYSYHQHPQHKSHQGGIVISGQEPLTSHMLAQAAPQEQKQLLGERIYALIEKLFPGHKDIGKVTGMMLEIDNSELIMMLQDTDLFRSKVEEASTVLTQTAQTNKT